MRIALTVHLYKGGPHMPTWGTYLKIHWNKIQIQINNNKCYPICNSMNNSETGATSALQNLSKEANQFNLYTCIVLFFFIWLQANRYKYVRLKTTCSMLMDCFSQTPSMRNCFSLYILVFGCISFAAVLYLTSPIKWTKPCIGDKFSTRIARLMRRSTLNPSDVASVMSRFLPMFCSKWYLLFNVVYCQCAVPC